ncbi:Mitochondrial Rho GTPase 2 [Smittium mucronatum]|uniref:Mitochondrial Rho GTPase 2 n=1 Tax=Smittium mucronatum TaxID=133383 RepID=A0A1R0GX01_9FUNG|nr:Mitochondrial Rho GTPase 2 [Smittium mucronatum]
MPDQNTLSKSAADSSISPIIENKSTAKASENSSLIDSIHSLDISDYAPLVTDDFDITTNLETALKEIFERYDLDCDSLLNDKELDDFAIFTNGEPFSKEEKLEISENLDCSEDGFLTLPGFIQMYSLQTCSGDELETWKDLLKHGYNKDLSLSSK